MLELLPWSGKLDPPWGWKFYGAGFLHSHWFPVVENSSRCWCFASFRSEDYRRCVSNWSSSEESWAKFRLERISTLWPRDLASLCVALSLSQQAIVWVGASYMWVLPWVSMELFWFEKNCVCCLKWIVNYVCWNVVYHWYCEYCGFNYKLPTIQLTKCFLILAACSLRHAYNFIQANKVTSSHSHFYFLLLFFVFYRIPRTSR